jgi:PAS domain S-box-containing protein
MTRAAFRIILLRLVLIPVMALFLLASLRSWQVRQMEQFAARLDKADRVIAQANEVLRIMVDEETGVRGFLATGQELFLRPYFEALGSLEPQLSHLRDLTADEPDQAVRAATIGERFRAFELLNAQVVKDRPEGESRILLLQQQKEKMDQLRIEVAELIRAEEAIHTQRTAGMEATRSLNTILSNGGLVLLVLLICWSTWSAFQRATTEFGAQLQEMRIQRDWLHTTLKSIGDAVIACDEVGRVSFMNPIAEALTGWSSDEARGHSLKEVFHIVNETTRIEVESPVDKVLRLGKIVGLANHTVLIAKDGAEVAIDDSGAPIWDRANRIAGIVLVFRDIGDRRKSEEALRRSEKLALVGRLSASIAHEMNNPLEGVTNLMYLIEQDSTLKPETRMYAQQASLELERVSKIATQTLRFAKRSSSAVPVRMEDILEGVFLIFTGRLATGMVEVVKRYRPTPPLVAHPNELTQIFTNLIGNAADALKGSGRLIVNIRSSRNWKTGQQGIAVTVADTAGGISEGVQDRIWEPFFTTKGEMGTGLGLWLVRDMVANNKGEVRLKSSTSMRRHGSVFRVFMPIG